MKINKVDSEDASHTPERAPLHGARLRTLEALFRHPAAHNLEWMDVVALIEKIGEVTREGNGKFGFKVGAERYQMPRTAHQGSHQY